GPALDTGRAQRRRDPGDASADPPRRNRRSADALAGGPIGADAEDEEGEAGRREDELTASGHLGGGNGQGPEGAGDDALTQPGRLRQRPGRVVPSRDPRSGGGDQRFDDPIGRALDRRTAAARPVLEVGPARPATQGRR